MASYTWVSRPDLSGTQFYLSSCSFALSSSTPTVTTGEPGDYDWLLVDYADRLYDWATYCGIPGGIPERTTIYAYMTPANTAAEINAAIAACPSGQVVYLAAGTYSLGQITFSTKSGVTLRGAGAGQTIINTTASQAIVNTTCYFYTADAIAMASGYAKDSTSIVLASTPSAAFAVGNLIAMYQTDSADLWATGIGVYHRTGLTTPWPIGAGYGFRFTTRITSVDGNTIGLAAPLPLTFSASLSPMAMPLRTGPTSSLCGVEDMTINGGGTADRAVSWQGADRCWVKGVEVDGVVGTTGMIHFSHSSQCEIRRCYAHDTPSFPTQADGYPYFLYYGCGGCLIIDNIAHYAAMSIVNGSAGNAVVYNYDHEIDRANFAATNRLAESQNCNHGPHGFMNLYEGNVTQSFQNDGYHGSTSHIVLFRNHISGLRTGTITTSRRVVDLCRGSYYHSAVGNIIGDASWTPAVYEYDPGDPSPVCMYILGFPGMGSVSMTAFTSVPWDNWAKPTDVPDADVAGTLLRHGNYDYFNHAAVWDGGIANHAVPNSLFYASKPAYFGSLAWPAIGPDVTGLVADIPAKHRWDNYLISADIADLFADEA